MTCKCIKRQLTQMANNVFKDARVAKKWLGKPGYGMPAPIDAIADPQVQNKNDIILHLYVSAALDKNQFDRETYDDRLDRFYRMIVVMKYAENYAEAKQKWSSHRIAGETKTVAEMLKNQQDSVRVQGAVINGYFGIHS